MGGLQPGGQARDGGAGLDPQIDRAGQGAPHAARPGQPVAKVGGVAPGAALGHLGLQKGLEHGLRLRTAGDHRQAALQHRDPGGAGHLAPHLGRAPGAPPDLAPLLPRDRHEAEVADRGAIGLGVTIDDHDALAQPRGRQGVGQAHDAGADHGKIEGLLQGVVFAYRSRMGSAVETTASRRSLALSRRRRK